MSFLNKYQSASDAPDSVLNTEATMNTPVIIRQRICPKKIKRQDCSSIQGSTIYNQKEKNRHNQTFHL